MDNAIKLFNDKKIRVEWEEDKEEWYFSVVDIVTILTENDFQGARIESLGTPQKALCQDS